MPSSPSTSRPSKALSRTAPFLLAALAALWTVPAAAQTNACDAARAGCGQIVPSSCGGTPAAPAPANLWGAELQPADTGALPAERDSTGFSEFSTYYGATNWFMGLSIQNNYLVTGSSHGLAVWDLHQDAAHPKFLGKLTDGAFPQWAIGEVKWPLQDLAMVNGDDTIAALAGESNIGIGIVDLSVKNTPKLLYQNHLKSGEEVYAANIGGTEYAFLAASQGSPSGGIYAFNMNAARQVGSATTCLEGVPATGETVHCPGVYVGKIGSSTAASYVRGIDNFIVFSSGGGGFEIWNVGNVNAPVQVMHGLDTAPAGSCQFAKPTVYGVDMWKDSGHYYLALRTQAYDCTLGQSISKGQIYDVSCIAGGACSLGNPIWSQPLYNDGTRSYFVTYSKGGANGYLYFGSEDRCNGTPEREYLYDVTIPALPHDVAPPGYWGWYYRGNPTGFNYVMPRRGKFNGSYFYRAALAILDVHQRVGSVAPAADFTFSPAQIYPGDTVSFTDQSAGGPTSWSWSFGPDGTAVGGTSATSRNPQVTFASQGAKTVSLTATNAAGASTPTAKTVTVLNPAPQIGAVTVSPASPLQCQPVTLTATGVTGKATLAYSWKITDPGTNAAPGGTSAANPFVWDTHLNNPLPQTYTATITVTNGVSSAAKSATFSLGALPALPTGGFAPTNQPFAAGTVQFSVNASGATEWNWDFGDGAGFTGWTSDPIAGPNPAHTYTSTGTKTVQVKVRNCLSDPNGLLSSPLSINIQAITPLVASFSASCAFAPCTFNAGDPVTFNDQSQGADHWDYDWTHTGASAATCNFTDAGHTSPVTTFTFATAGTYQPCLRVRRGASESNVYVHPVLHVGSGVVTLPPRLTISGSTSGAPGTALALSAVASNCTPSASGWTWTLTGGTPPTSNAASVSVTYAAAGTYTAIVTNTGCAGAQGAVTVIISSGNGGNGGNGGGGLAAAFTFSPGSPSAGQPVSFDGSSSTGNPSAFGWDFGDGSAAGSGKTTSHTYANAGNYSVVLTVCNGGNCLSSAPKTVVVGPAGGVTPLDPSFTASGANCFNQFGLKECDASAGAAINLAASTTQATSYAWDFGDGTTGSGASVSHTWAHPGNYSVKLTVANAQTTSSQTLLFKIGQATATGSSVLLPWIAQTRGVLVQSSDLYVHNPGTAPMDVTLEFRRRGTPETNPPRVTKTVAPGATLFSADVLTDLFGRPEDTVGFVTVSAASGAAPIITSYNTTFQTNGSQFGQTISGVAMAQASGQTAAQGTAVQHLVGLNDNATEVSYFGLANPNDQPATYRLSLFDNQGRAVGAPTSFTVARLGLKQFQREEIESTFGVSNLQDYRVEIDSISGGPLYPYGAKLRTASFDPSFVIPGETRSRIYVLGALSTPGLASTLWRSDIVVSNTTDKVIQTTMRFLRVGVASSPLAPVSLTLQPGETQRLANVVADKWGVTDAVGVLIFDTDTSANGLPVVQGESYDFSTGVRRFGQSMPALSTNEAASAGQGQYLVGLRQDAMHWTAFWLFNPSDAYGTYDLVYRDLSGNVIGQITGLSLPPGKSKLFRPSEHPIPAAGVDGGFTVQIMVKAGQALAAGQVVNLTTNDPAYILGTTR